MQFDFYKVRKGRLLAGVLAGLAHKLGIEAWIVRLFFLISLSFGAYSLLSLVLYLSLAYVLPYKEDQDAERYGMGPRKIKDAEKIK